MWEAKTERNYRSNGFEDSVVVSSDSEGSIPNLH